MKVRSNWLGAYAASAAVVVSTLATVAAPARGNVPTVEKLTFEQAKKQLLRKSGQTEFLDLQYAPNALADAPGGARGASAKAESASADGGDRRNIVESDVFAVDPATKNLYLLTDDRGLIVLDKNDDITGRVAASGNRPDMMYLFSDKKTLVVLEQDWEQAFAENGSADASRNSTKIVQYDISKPDRPKVNKVVPLEGTVVDSRVVGKVLYITSSVYPQENYSRWGFFPSSRRSQEPKGRVYSVNLDDLSVVGSVDSQLQSGQRNMIRIVEQEQGGKYQYFALAVSPQDVDEYGWWWRRASQVEVFDITDANGAVKPIFRTSLKGNIQKATQVNLSNGYVVAVSNYPTDLKDRWSKPWRLAAESFKLPTASDKVIKKVEAEYRLDQIKTKVEGLKDEELTAKLDTLYDDATIGLRNVFVRMEDGVLSKYVPDSVDTSGDTTGLSANLRDVRFGQGKDGIEIYAFWVPNNNIDPFDLFKLNTSTGKISYTKRLQYDGWAERAIPFEHDGKKLILSLGYIVKANDPQMRRYPQVLLFEVSGSGKKTKLEKLDDMTLANKGIWADLQGEDKEITFSYDAKTGKGAVLFPVSGYSAKQGSFSGGKIVGFDLANIDSDDSVFKDGALILGESGWMKRVFEDSRSQVLRTLSNEEIAAFPSFADALKTTDEKLDAIRRIELARDMIAFLPVADGKGLQVVRKGAYSEKASTQLRLVARTNADTDATKVTAKIDIPGNYAGHYAVSDEKFLVFSNRNFSRPSTDKARPWDEWVTEFGIYVVGLDTATSKISILSKNTWENKSDSGDVNELSFNSWGGDPATQLPTVVSFGKHLLWNSGYLVFQVDTSDLTKISAKKFDIGGLPSQKDGVYSARLMAMGGDELAVYYSKEVSVEAKNEKENRWGRLSVARGFFARVETTTDGSSAQIKGKAVNIPGNPLGLFASNGVIVTSESAVTDILEEGDTGYRTNQAPYLQSLTLGADTASLSDSMQSNELAQNGYRRIGDALVSLKSEQQQSWGPVWGRAMMMDVMPGRPGRGTTTTKANLEIVTVSASGQLALDARVLPRYALPGHGSLLTVIAKPGKTDEFVLPIGSGSRIQVYEYKTGTMDLTPKGLYSYDEYNTKSADNSLVVRIPGTGRWYYWGWYGSANPSVTLDPAGDRLFVSMGLSGVFTLDVTDAPKIAKVQPKDEEPEPLQGPGSSVESDPLP